MIFFYSRTRITLRCISTLRISVQPPVAFCLCAPSLSSVLCSWIPSIYVLRLMWETCLIFVGW